MKAQLPATVLALVVLACSQLSASAARIIIADGVNEVPGEFPTIQAALDAAASGEIVKVAPGTYRENLVFGYKSVELVSAEGPETTVIDAGGGKIATFGWRPNLDYSQLNPTCQIKGFTLKNGAADESGAITISGDLGVILTGNIFENNCTEATACGPVIHVLEQNGFFVFAPSYRIEHNVFRGNGCESVDSSCVIRMNSSGTYWNNLFHDNPCKAIIVGQPPVMPGLYQFVSSAYFINNTLVRNKTAFAIESLGSNAVFRNNLIYQNGTGLSSYRDLTGRQVWDHNLVFGNDVDHVGTPSLTGTEGNLSADPLLVDAANGDFRLTRQSPALEAGNNVAAPTVDLEGESRPADANGDDVAVTDIGMDEYHGGLRLLVDGGFVHESASTGGTDISVTLIPSPGVNEMTKVQLYLNGVEVADTSPATVRLPLGESMLEAIVETPDGTLLDAARKVTVVDTTGPVIRARFVDRRTGNEIPSLSSPRLNSVLVKIELEDNGDPDPKYESVLGMPVRDGQQIAYRGARRSMTLDTQEMTLNVVATDAGGNVSTLTRKLTVDAGMRAAKWEDLFK